MTGSHGHRIKKASRLAQCLPSVHPQRKRRRNHGLHAGQATQPHGVGRMAGVCRQEGRVSHNGLDSAAHYQPHRQQQRLASGKIPAAHIAICAKECARKNASSAGRNGLGDTIPMIMMTGCS